MLGSFPPQQKRWSMNFFYPNMQNDMWRIYGLIFFGDRSYFVDEEHKCFNQTLLEDFLTQKGIALYDTAQAVNRLRDNASDKFLEVIEYTDVDSLLRALPECTAIVTTGQKATDVLRTHYLVDEPKVGDRVCFDFEGRKMKLYRMPSSSRAYPLKLEKKAEVYRKMLLQEGLLSANE